MKAVKRRLFLRLFIGNSCWTDGYIPVKDVKEENQTLLCFESYLIN